MMERSVFESGYNLPPGCTEADLARQAGDLIICPECDREVWVRPDGRCPECFIMLNGDDEADD